MQQELHSIPADRGELTLSPIFQSKSTKKQEDGLDETKRKIKKFETEIRNAEQKQWKSNAKSLVEIMNEEGVEEEQDVGDVIEDARRTKFYFRKMQMVEGGSFVFALISIFISIIEYEIRFRHHNNTYIVVLLLLMSINTLILGSINFFIKQVFLTVIRYSIEIVLMKEQRIISQRDDILSSGRFYSLLMELLIIVPHPNLALRGIKIISYDLYDSIQVEYELNDYLEIYILLRTFILFRVLLNTTEYASTRATRICRMYGCEPGYFYAAKCLMSETPLRTVTILFLVAILLGGQAIRICEQQWRIMKYYYRPLTLLTPDDAKDFGMYLNCFWCMIITMATVGYGDYYARTIPGRFVTLIAAIVGVFLVSIMVVALTNTLNMNPAEQKAHNVINRLSVRSDLIEQAANLLTSAAKFSLDNKKGVIPQSQIKNRLESIKKHATSFRSANRTLKSMFDASNLSEEMARHFDHLKDDLREIYENQVMLRDYLLKLKKNTTLEETEDDHFSKFNLRV